MQPDSLGKKIRRLRINNCLSQARLAEAVDVSTNYIGQIERGDRTPSLETTIALAMLYTQVWIMLYLMIFPPEMMKL